jgi:hypothetical protein
MVDEFLKLEYQQSLDLVKHYDNRQLELLKVASALTAVIPTLVLTFYNLGAPVRERVWDFAGGIALATVLSLLPLYAALVETRLYFVFPARQLNAIRGHLLPEDFKDLNCMYDDPKYPLAFRVMSTQTLMYIFVALQTGLFAAVALYGLLDIPVDTAVTWAGLLSLAMVVAAAGYLRARGTKAPSTRRA